MPEPWSTCPSCDRAPPSISNPSAASMRMRCAPRACTSSAATNSASPVGRPPSDFTRGYDGGVADAQTALGLHAAAGGPDSAPIFFSIDEDIDAGTWKSVAAQWLQRNQLGAERGAHRCLRGRPGCGWAIGDGVIGHSTTPGYRWAWQTGRGRTVSVNPRPCSIRASSSPRLTRVSVRRYPCGRGRHPRGRFRPVGSRSVTAARPCPYR